MQPENYKQETISYTEAVDLWDKLGLYNQRFCKEYHGVEHFCQPCSHGSHFKITPPIFFSVQSMFFLLHSLFFGGIADDLSGALNDLISTIYVYLEHSMCFEALYDCLGAHYSSGALKKKQSA